VSDIRSALVEVHKGVDPDEWGDMSTRNIRKLLEKKLDIAEGTLKNKEGLTDVISLFDEELRQKEESLKHKKKGDDKDKDKKQKKKQDSDDEKKKRKSEHKKRSDDKDKKKSKRKRDSASEHRSSKKSRKYSTSESDSDTYKRRRRHRTKKYRNPDDPVVKKIEQLRKVIRGCGVPLTGFSQDMSDDRILKKLRKIIEENEKYGMKEKMKKSEMHRVKATIEGKREVEDLLQIPKKLATVDRNVPRKTRKRNISYEIVFPTTGVDDVDKIPSSSSPSDSEQISNYSSGSE